MKEGVNLVRNGISIRRAAEMRNLGYVHFLDSLEAQVLGRLEISRYILVLWIS